MPRIIGDVQSLTCEQRNFLLLAFATSEFFLARLIDESMSGGTEALQSLAASNNKYLADVFSKSLDEQDALLQEYLTINE